MGSNYFEHKLIKPNSIELRDYQTNLSDEAKNENSLVVLPTGLGKTTIALQIMAHVLSQNKGGVLFLAPTRVLVNQHYDFLKENLLLDDIGIVTGEDLINKRKKSWINSVICATPEITKNDLDRQIEQFGNKVGFIIAAEMTGKVSSEEAYQMIKSEMKGLKEYRKLFKRDSVEKRKGKRD